MEYILSEEEFKKSFKVNDNEDGTPNKLTHTSGRKIKIFPFSTRKEMPTIQQVIGDYLRSFEDEIPTIDNNASFIDRLGNKVETDHPKEFKEIITDLFFTKEEDGSLQMKPLNIELMSLITCEDKYLRLSRYLASVLGSFDNVKKEVEKSRSSQQQKSNVLEKFIKDEINYRDNSFQVNENRYFKIIRSLDECFDEDFKYIVSSEDRVKEYLEELLGLYYLNYTIQASVQLNCFMDGERNRLKEVYYCLEWEKTNQNRLCYKLGWRSVQDALSKMFVHVNVLEMLNLTQNTNEKFDYIYLKELLNNGSLNDAEVAYQIKKINNLYNRHILDVHLDEIGYKDYPTETESAIQHLFQCVETQFQNSERHAPLDKFTQSFTTDYCKENYIQTRGRSGDMLCISEDRLIFLTKLCIKDLPKMRLNDVFNEFSKRGIFFDPQSKAAVTDFYERLNLIEKKSDSGDAQYVKRIL